VVQRSGRPGLEPGDVVVAIDGKPTGDFVAERMKYMTASSDRGRRTHVFFFSPLWPQQFEVTLAGGRRVQIDRSREPVASGASRIWVFAPRGHAPDDVAYLPIPTFDDPRQEQNAVAFLKTHKDAPAVIIDLRGNGGGSTPEALIRAIMDRPWPGWIESTSVLFPLFRTYGERFSPKNAATNPRGEGYLEAFAEYFSHPYMMLPEPLHPPENPVYTGRVILIADLTCGSACEDFVMPLKYSGRATVVGETTGGSSGQPYICYFGNGMMFRVGTKRMYFPDGSEFEGVGIKPDIEVSPTPADIKTGRDPVLERAVALARAR
jgi:carboxyl-terminal processing protease